MCILSEHPVLVLNKGWVPVDVVTLEKAICMVLTTYKNGSPKATILDPTHDFRRFTWDDWKVMKAAAGEKVVRSAHDAYRVPDIIILTRHDKFRKPETNFNRRGIFHRDNFTCQYCGKKFPTSELSIEHVNPRRLGGKSTWENCVIACVKCNLRKGGRTPEQAGMKLLRKPVKPKHHFFPYRQYKVKTWEEILGVAYWETELES